MRTFYCKKCKYEFKQAQHSQFPKGKCPKCKKWADAKTYAKVPD